MQAYSLVAKGYIVIQFFLNNADILCLNHGEHGQFEIIINA